MPRMIQAYSLAAVLFAWHVCATPGQAEAPPTGEQLCFEKGEWERGIPLLAKSKDFAFGELGRAELAPPTDLQGQITLADDWRKQAEIGPAQYKAAMRSRAIFWYRRALTQAKGAERTPLLKAVDQLTLDIAFDSDDADWSIPAAFAGRDLPARQKLLDARGGSPKTEDAVSSALAWILKRQHADGSWSFRGPNLPPFRKDEGDIRAENGATAMALLPLLARGHTHRHGEHKQAIKSGLAYLRGRAKLDEKLLDCRDEGGNMYSQALATLVFVEAYALTGDEELQVAAQQAVDFIVAAQHTAGGWRYTPQAQGDSSVTAWQVQALVSARLANLKVPDKTLLASASFMRGVRQGDFFGYMARGDGSLAMAAGGAFSLAQLPEPNATDQRASIKLVARMGAKEQDPYYNYYAQSLVLHADPVEHKHWNDALTGMLLDAQVQDGPDRGSWYFEKDFYVKSGGRLYCTSLSTLTLEAYYRYATFAPEYQAAEKK